LCGAGAANAHPTMRGDTSMAETHINIRFEFPTHEELIAVAKRNQLDDMAVMPGDFNPAARTFDAVDVWMRDSDVETWTIHLLGRLGSVRLSYWLMQYYADKGIPDERWYMSPGRSGQSIEYFPDFDEEAHSTKFMFDYAADAFYAQLFAAWDNLAQAINDMHALGLGIKDVSLWRVVSGLKTVVPSLHADLAQLTSDPDHKQALELRRCIQHRHSPSNLSSSFERVTDTVTSIGVGGYTTSAEVLRNAQSACGLLGSAIEAARKSVGSDTVGNDSTA